MNDNLKETLMKMSKEQLISYIDLMLNVIIDLENKNKELKAEREVDYGKRWGIKLFKKYGKNIK